MRVSIIAKEAVIGSFVADAATMGLHWIYDTSKIDQLIADGKSPDFFQPPSCPFYKYETGRNSPYGEEMLPTLEYLATHDKFNTEGLQEALYNWSTAYDGRLNHLMVDFQEAYKSGKRGKDFGDDNIQAHAMCKAGIFAALYGDMNDEDYIAKCTEIIVANQTNQMALNYGIGAALLVKHILEGHSIDDSIEWLCKHPKTPAMVVESIQKVDAEITAGTSDRDAVKKFGASCKSDGAFESSIFFLKTSETYTKAIQANILAGGDNCSRSMFIGAAYAGSMGIPAEWKDKSKNYIKVAALLER